jgi:glucose-1-phosphate thymidylyltransferase
MFKEDFLLQAVILAAGRGERMRPLTDQIPKCLLTINGDPVIDQIIYILKNSGIDDITVVAGYLKEEVINHLKGQDISFCIQEKTIGTGNALLQAKNSIDKDFICLAADTIFLQSELEKMISYFKKNNPDILVGLKKVPRHELARRSTVKVERGKILQIIEKPLAGKELSDISAMPIFMFNKNIWKYVNNLKPSKNRKYELAIAIQNSIDDGLKVEGFYFTWSHDITYPSDVS